MSTIGWIGTGVMGRPMAHHLVEAGHRLTIFTRTKSKAKQLLEAGAEWANSPQEAAKDKDFVCTMVGYPQDLQEVVFGKEGVINTIKAGSIFIDFNIVSRSNPAFTPYISASTIPTIVPAICI